jgi:hypothetical protein
MKFGKYLIESDPLNVTVSELKKATHGEHAGKEYVSILGYFSSLGNAMKWIVDNEINCTGMKDIETVVKKIDELKKMVEGFNEGI